jgi:hypothetical protein
MRALSARTAQELLEEPIAEADWVIEDLLPVGAHIFAGAPKIGKSWMVLAIEYFVITHPDLKLIFLDTFQKVRSLAGDSIYAADYNDFSALKSVADKHSLAMMVVRHTRKMADEDIMDTVSGSSGITGSADSIWVLKKRRVALGMRRSRSPGAMWSSGS